VIPLWMMFAFWFFAGLFAAVAFGAIAHYGRD
jgi:hypothetical protein